MYMRLYVDKAVIPELHEAFGTLRRKQPSRFFVQFSLTCWQAQTVIIQVQLSPRNQFSSISRVARKP